MTINKLASQVAKLEGKRSQARIGDIREILGHLSDMAYEDITALGALFENGKRRAKRKAKVRK